MSWKKGQAIHLETPRFRLESMRRRQIARASLPWTEDPEVMGAMEMRAGNWLPRRWRRRFSRFDDKRAICLGIFEKASGALIGYHTAQINDDVVFIGVMVGDRRWWGQGAVAETRAELVRFLFEEAGMERVYGTPYGRNMPSIYNYQRLGFVYEGALRQQRRGLKGERIDMPIFGLMREEWRARQAARKDAAGKDAAGKDKA